MFWFILAIVLALAGIALIFIKAVQSEDGKKTSTVGIGIAVLVIAFLSFFVGGIKHVPARNIGIPTTFSNVQTNAYGPGYHVTWQPWKSLVDAPETIQTTKFEGCQGQYCTDPSQPRGNCLEVRIGGQQTACVDVTVQWRINPNGAGTLYNNYANQDDNLTDAIRDFLIDRELRTVENTDMDAYNPILDAQNIGGGSSNSTFLQFASQIQTQMQTDLGTDVTVIKVLQPLAYYTASTESFLHQIQNKSAEDQVAILQQKVNSDTAVALHNLGTPTADQLLYLCLTSVVPHAAGWNCDLFGGSSSNTAVAVPAK